MPSRRTRSRAPESAAVPGPAPAPRRGRRSFVLGVVLLVGLGCRPGSGAAEPLPTGPDAIAAEIAQLEAQIEADRATLAGYVTESRDLDAAPFHEDEALRAIADRLTAHTARLERLRAAATARDAR